MKCHFINTKYSHQNFKVFKFSNLINFIQGHWLYVSNFFNACYNLNSYFAFM